jgi:hypothetical protein
MFMRRRRPDVPEIKQLKLQAKEEKLAREAER